jgi:hypothetical protein
MEGITLDSMKEWALSLVELARANLPATPTDWVAFVFMVVGALSIATGLLPYLRSFLFFRQSLRKRYGATWALVTGVFVHPREQWRRGGVHDAQ